MAPSQQSLSAKRKTRCHEHVWLDSINLFRRRYATGIMGRAIWGRDESGKPIVDCNCYYFHHDAVFLANTRRLFLSRLMAYCMPCNVRANRREGVGPTGKKEWMILVDTCHRCGRHYPLHPHKLTLEQKSWVKRINKLAEQKPEPLPEPPADTSHHGRWVMDTSSQGGHFE